LLADLFGIFLRDPWMAEFNGRNKSLCGSVTPLPAEFTHPRSERTALTSREICLTSTLSR
jgi:hypothetical protein